jgi:MraZ protein
MTINDQRCKGAVTYKMDPKARVSIPVAWRPGYAEPLFLLESNTHEMPMIKVLTNEAYLHRVNLIKDSDHIPAEKTRMLGKLAMNSKEVQLNEQGKLLIPKELCERVGLAAEAELVLAGRGLHFEVWNKENHARFVEIENALDANDTLGVF